MLDFRPDFKAYPAHHLNAGIPRVSMRQWVLSMPKRLRPALRADAVLKTRVSRAGIIASPHRR